MKVFKRERDDGTFDLLVEVETPADMKQIMTGEITGITPDGKGVTTRHSSWKGFCYKAGRVVGRLYYSALRFVRREG